MTKKTARRFAVVLGVSMMAATGTVSASAAATKHIKCTPGVHKGKPFKSVIKGHAGLYRRDVVYPKNSGHEIIGGMCQANKKGLGRKKLVTIKLFPKVTKPKPTPPTTVVGNPPTVVVTPPAPPVVVTPPANPTPPPAPVLTAALSLTATADVNDVLVDMNQNTDKFDVSINGTVLGTVTHQANGLAADLPVQAHVGDTAKVCQQTDQFGFLPDEVCLTHTFTSADATSKHVFAFHNHKTVRFSCDDVTFEQPVPGQTTLLLSAHYSAFNATRVYANFDYGDGTGQHTSLGGDFGIFGGSVIYPGPGLYRITVIVSFSISNGPTLSPLTVSTIAQPATFDVTQKSCTKWVQMLPAPAV